MIMLSDKERNRKKEFRKFLKSEQKANGLNLYNLMQAADLSLPRFIRVHLDSSFSSLYSNDFSVYQLGQYFHIMESHDEWLTEQNGYISLRCLDLFIDFYCEQNGISPIDVKKQSSEKSSQWDDEDRSITEGRGTDQTSIRYERSKKARERCLKRWGYKCYICGLDFETVYGEIGKGFIEVHHKVPIAQRKGEYELVPERDMVPLCSNCHSMVHYKTIIPRDVDVLKELINKRKA